MDCPDGELGKDKILDMYSMILPVGNAKVFVDQIFRIFDKDGNGTIDFKVSHDSIGLVSLGVVGATAPILLKIVDATSTSIFMASFRFIMQSRKKR